MQNVWLGVRGALVVAAFIGGAFSPPTPTDAGYSPTIIALAALVFGVVAILLVIGLQAFNPRCAPKWGYPSWLRNPFTMREPLQFFHLGGYFFLASGMGGLVSAAFRRSAPSFELVALASYGAGILVGVRLCTALFRKKMTLGVA